MPLTVYRRGEIYHYRGTVAGRRLRGSTGTSDRKLAQRITAEVEACEWKRHLDGPGAQVTFTQCAIAYRRAGKATRFLNPIEDHFREALVRDITPGGVKAAALRLYPTATAATRNRQVLKPTCAIINFAAELGWCSRLTVTRFSETTAPKVPVTREWVETFAEHASPHLGALCIFMFATGARIGEALAVDWADIDFTERTAKIHQGKVDDTRIAHLPREAIVALANIPSDREPGEHVFGYAARDSVYDSWHAAIDRAGIKRLTPHSCRHGFATALLQRGVDVKTVARLGGWKDAATVLRTYAHAVEDRTLTDALFDTPVTQRPTKASVKRRKQRRISA